MALDNLVTVITSTASRSKDAVSTEIATVGITAGSRGDEKPIINGSILRVTIKGFFPYDEVGGLQPVPIEKISQPFVYVPPKID